MADTADGPREHRLRLAPRAYDQVEAGRRTIDVRVATARTAGIAAGDTIVFHEQGGRELDIAVGRVTPYTSFEALLDTEDAGRIDPDATRDDLLGALRAAFPRDREALGVLAVAFDHRPVRPGRRFPVEPSRYLETLPRHTVYAALYLRDAHDRPVLLRSVHGTRPWQFPGGDLDAGEDPLRTARRETREETGLDLGGAAPRLLLTHYLTSGPASRLAKVGFVFDGGRLTADRLRCVRLDPGEHDMWAVHDLAAWRALATPREFARLHAVEQARRGEGPAYLVTHA